MSAPTSQLSPETEVMLADVCEKLTEKFASELMARMQSVVDVLEMQADQSREKDGHDRLRAAASDLQSMESGLENGTTMKVALFGDMLNGGATGESWRRDISALDSLLHSVRAQQSIEERAELLRNLPLLQSRPDDGAKSVDADPAYVETYLTRLRNTHAKSLSGVLRGGNVLARTDRFSTVGPG